MNPCQKPSPRRLQNPAHRPAFAWLDAALAENAPFDNREKIRRMREAYFADVEEYLKTNPLILPKPCP
jgi:hypothetical protein